MRVETQGSVGAKNRLTDEEIERADAVILAADAYVDPARFAGKRLFQTTTKAALHDGRKVIEEALALPAPGPAAPADGGKDLKAPRTSTRTGPYKHLMTGVSYMLPLVVAGGLLIAGLRGGRKQAPGRERPWAMMRRRRTALDLFR